MTNTTDDVGSAGRDRPALDTSLIVPPEVMAQGSEILRDWLGEGRNEVTTLEESIHGVLEKVALLMLGEFERNNRV